MTDDTMMAHTLTNIQTVRAEQMHAFDGHLDMADFSQHAGRRTSLLEIGPLPKGCHTAGSLQNKPNTIIFSSWIKADTQEQTGMCSVYAFALTEFTHKRDAILYIR